MSLDLAIIRGAKPNTTVAYATPSLVQEGTLKVVTKFASIFFSDFNPTRDRGTDFIRRYRTGRILTAARLRQEFAIAAAEVIRQLGDQTGVPDTEALVQARLLEAEIATNYETYLRVLLTTRSGEVDIQLPVERTP
jgi:hypothetical protein